MRVSQKRSSVGFLIQSQPGTDLQMTGPLSIAAERCCIGNSEMEERKVLSLRTPRLTYFHEARQRSLCRFSGLTRGKLR